MKGSSEARNLVTFDSLAEAMGRQDFDQADKIATRLPPPVDARHWSQLAELHLVRHRWQDAAAALGAIESRDTTTEMRRRMAANLASFQQHRPDVYQVLVNAPGNPAYQVVPTADGYLTTVYTNASGRKVSLSPGHDPIRNLPQARKQLADAMQADLNNAVLALCGIGDGYLLHSLAGNETKLFLDMQLPVQIIEPQTQVLLNALMIHDYSGPTGPIEQKRFCWYVGRNWCELMFRHLQADSYLPMPTLNVCLGIDAAEIESGISQLNLRLAAENEKLISEYEAYYAQLSSDDLADVLSTDRPRRPRVLLLTTRFSTVLQYSTRDAAEALSQIGCETHLIIEPTAYHRLAKRTIIQAISRFRPDLVLQIDHLRAEHQNLFPARLPFVCWIQDHLSNLTSNAAAANVGARDFVMNNIPTYFCKQFGYPAKQMIAMPQLGRVPIRPTFWASDGEDIIYVSNWSRTIEQSINELHERFSQTRPMRDLLEDCSRRLVAIYQAGRSLPTHIQVHDVLRESMQQTGLTIPNAQQRHLLMESIFDRLNNTLYRQQALQWAVDAAQQMGLTLAIYGRGWESHPQFSAHARGPVAPGADLENLTRRAKINLQLEPYACFTHARLMTGLFAGGFFLIRDHPFNHLSQELIEFLDTHGCAEAKNVSQASAMIDPSLAGELESLLARCSVMNEQLDCVELSRDWQDAKMILSGDEALPRIHEVVFNSRDDLQSKLQRFLADEDLRREVVLNQRDSLEQRLSYATGMRRMLRIASERIRAGAAINAMSETRKCA